MAKQHGSSTHLHILPIRTYLTIGAMLLVMTGITVAVAQFDFGEANLIVAMFIAAFKASLVVLFFMHLKYDNKIYSLIFVGSLVFLALFISLTMLDTLRRDDIYEQVAQPIVKQATYQPLGEKRGEEGAEHGAAGKPAEPAGAMKAATADSTKAHSADTTKAPSSGSSTH